MFKTVVAFTIFFITTLYYTDDKYELDILVLLSSKNVLKANWDIINESR